jgi:antitoxin component YwqK of YwqJK toxin-antitoxin module
MSPYSESWHENGQLNDHCIYANGRWNGLRAKWNKDGELIGAYIYVCENVAIIEE